MGDVADILKIIYEDFFLRDFFAKIIPGFIFLSVVYFSLFSCPHMRHIPHLETIHWFLILGLSWIFAFMIQYIGWLLGLTKDYYWKEYRNAQGDTNQNIPTHPQNIGDRWHLRGKHDKLWFKEYILFQKVATTGEKKTLSRYMLIKEACGNLCVSLILSLGVICLLEIFLLNILLIFLVLAISIFCLWRMHLLHVKRQTEYLEAVIEDRCQMLRVGRTTLKSKRNIRLLQKMWNLKE